jgi:ribosomal protein L36
MMPDDVVRMRKRALIICMSYPAVREAALKVDPTVILKTMHRAAQFVARKRSNSRARPAQSLMVTFGSTLTDLQP